MITLMIILGFGLTVFVHELGHFLMARRSGVRVLVFSVGMGPRIFTFLKDKKGTEWILSAIPIGGYVKMLGQEDMPGATPTEGANSDNYQAKKPRQKLGIIMAGVTMNAVFAYLLLVVAFTVGVPFTSNTIGGTLPYYPAEKSGLKAGDTIVDINGREIETWEDVIVAVSFSSPGEPLDVKVDRAGSLLTFQTATTDRLTIDSETIDLPLPQLGLYPHKAPMVSQVNEDELLKKIGLKPGQIVEEFKIDGKVFTTAEGIEQAITHGAHKPYEMTVRGNGELKQVQGKVFARSTVKSGYQHVALISPLPGGACEKAGLKQGDVIKKIGKKTIRGWDDLQQYSAAITSAEPLTMFINRQGEKIIKTVRPQYNAQIERYLLGVRHFSTMKAKEISYVEPWLLELFNAPRVGDIMLSFEQESFSSWEKLNSFLFSSDTEVKYVYNYNREGIQKNAFVLERLMKTEETGHLIFFSYAEKTIKYPFYKSLYKSIYRGYQEISEAVFFLSSLLKGEISMELVGGPIKIFQISHIVAESKGWGYFLLLFAKIGFSLAVINSLPIPVLDGGHAVFILYEMIRGKSAPQNVISALHYIGFVFLLSLFAFVMYNDIVSLMTG